MLHVLAQNAINHRLITAFPSSFFLKVFYDIFIKKYMNIFFLNYFWLNTSPWHSLSEHFSSYRLRIPVIKGSIVQLLWRFIPDCL